MSAKAKRGIVVTLEYVNYLGEVTDSSVIAKFRSKGWAKDFIFSLRAVRFGTAMSECVRYKVEIKSEDIVGYITYKGIDEVITEAFVGVV